MSACPLCGGPGRPAFEKGGHVHAACQACGSWFVDPVPPAEALAAFYQRAAEEAGSRLCWEGSSAHAHALWDRALEAVRRRGGGPLLDVGCGAGQFLAHARRRGFQDLAGVEPSPAAAAAARLASGAVVHELELSATPPRPGGHAAVTLWDVLEHLPAPRAARGRARALLRPGGLLGVATPNRRGLSALAFGARALVVSPPEHLLVATRRGLAAALQAEGLRLLRLESLELRLREWTGGGGEAAAGPAAASGGAARDRYRGAYDRLTGWGGFGLLHAAGNAVLSAARLGDQLLAIAERPAGPGDGPPGPG